MLFAKHGVVGELHFGQGRGDHFGFVFVGKHGHGITHQRQVFSDAGTVGFHLPGEVDRFAGVLLAEAQGRNPLLFQGEVLAFLQGCIQPATNAVGHGHAAGTFGCKVARQLLALLIGSAGSGHALLLFGQGFQPSALGVDLAVGIGHLLFQPAFMFAQITGINPDCFQALAQLIELLVLADFLLL